MKKKRKCKNEIYLSVVATVNMRLPLLMKVFSHYNKGFLGVAMGYSSMTESTKKITESNRNMLFYAVNPFLVLPFTFIIITIIRKFLKSTYIEGAVRKFINVKQEMKSRGKIFINVLQIENHYETGEISLLNFIFLRLI